MLQDTDDLQRMGSWSDGSSVRAGIRPKYRLMALERVQLQFGSITNKHILVPEVAGPEEAFPNLQVFCGEIAQGQYLAATMM